MTSKLTSTAAMAMMVAATAGVAQARAQAWVGDAPRAVVSYADLNLNDAAGRAQLARRIAAAAATICGPAPSIRDLASDQAYRVCLKATISNVTPTPQEAADLQGRTRLQVAEAGRGDR